MAESKKQDMRDALRRVAMSFELEDILRKFRKQKNAAMSEEKTLRKLTQLLSSQVTSHSISVKGNTSTNEEFIKQELSVKTPNSIETCSTQVLDGLNRLESDLDIFSFADAVIDVDSENADALQIDVTVKEKSRLTARIGASHSFGTPVNGDMSVGIRNVFGRGETLEVCSNVGLSSESVQSLQDVVHNTSNQYSIEFKKPRINVPFLPFIPLSPAMNATAHSGKPYLSVKAFRESLDRSSASSYHRETVGATMGLLSPDLEQWLEYKYHFRSAVIDRRTNGDSTGGKAGKADSIAPSLSDYNFPSVKSSMEYKLMRDTRDHTSLPTKGYQSAANVEVAGIGADVDFVKLWTRFENHWQLPPHLFDAILNLGLETGLAMPWKRKVMKSNGDSYLRVIDRLVPMAGLQARGFEYGKIGPREGQDYVHCDFLFAVGASLTFPLLREYFLYGNLFCNAVHCGLLRDTPITDIGDNLRMSSGLSIVLPTPVARIEMGYAHPVRTHGDPFSKFFCSFGFSFF